MPERTLFIVLIIWDFANICPDEGKMVPVTKFEKLV